MAELASLLYHASFAALHHVMEPVPGWGRVGLRLCPMAENERGERKRFSFILCSLLPCRDSLCVCVGYSCPSFSPHSCLCPCLHTTLRCALRYFNSFALFSITRMCVFFSTSILSPPHPLCLPPSLYASSPPSPSLRLCPLPFAWLCLMMSFSPLWWTAVRLEV